MILVLTGPTGSGKSELAISLAKKLDAAIINADAFQVYQELGVATAKPTRAMMEQAPHFLYDFVPLDSSYNVAEYQQDMRSVLSFCLEKHPNVIIAGGTGLYIKAALYDYEFVEHPEIDMTPYRSMDLEKLYETLVRLDPEAAAKIHPHNRVRVERAIEIFLAGGERKSDMEARQTHRPIYPAIFFGLEYERSDLYERVNQRVDSMFEHGLLEETLPLIEKYGREAAAFRAIGVKELFPYIDGAITLDEAKETIKKNTRNYIKRQMTWFRNQFDLVWVENQDQILDVLAQSA